MENLKFAQFFQQSQQFLEQMENSSHQSFVIAELISKPLPKTAHELSRPTSMQGSLKNICLPSNNQIKEQTKPKSKSKDQLKQHKKTGKISSKCVRIMVNSSKSIGSKSLSCQHISSDSKLQCSLDEIDLDSKQKPVQETLTIQNIKKSAIMKNENNKIKSFRDLKLDTGPNIQKSSKSIKFSEKKDVFTYKGQNKKQGSKKRTKSLRKISLPLPDESQQCCQLI